MRQGLLKYLPYLWFLALILSAYGPSLGLNLYGDDWFVISIYYGNFGPGHPEGYINSQLFTTNYGPQFIAMAILYALFKEYALPYFITSLLLRFLTTVGLYWLVTKVATKKISLVVSTLFAVSAAGAETTDWVYNMNSYLGIFFVLVGLGYLINPYKFKDRLAGWFFTILGYMSVIIRVYVLPFLLVLLEFFKGIANREKFSRSLLKSAAFLSPFLLIKQIFPGMGFQGIIFQQINDGLKVANEYISTGRYDFLLYPFVYIGRMTVPFGLEELWSRGWAVYPISKFLIIGGGLGLIAGLIIWFSDRKLTKNKLFISFVKSFVILFALKLFVRYQGIWLLKEFPFFVWAYIGILVSFILVVKLVSAVRNKQVNNLPFWTITASFTYSFLLTWAYVPQSIPIPQSRYLILSSIGLAMFWGWVLVPHKSYRILQIFFITGLLFVHVVSSRAYFNTHLAARNYEYSQDLFRQLKNEVPKISESAASVFYFENVHPWVFEELFRFGFGYHMQLVYNLPYSDQGNFPYGVSTKGDLIKAVSDPNFGGRLYGSKKPTKIENVYAFRLEGNKLVNITAKVRRELSEIVK